jgi:tetratricopeptide (TPR) repeat protein
VSMQDKKETEEDNKAERAYALYLQGKYIEAFVLYLENLKKDPNHYPSLLGYAEEITRRGNYKEALSVILRILIHYAMLSEPSTESERSGKLFSMLLEKPGSLPYLLQLMGDSNSKGNAEALHFLAKTAMQHGELVGAIELYKAAVKSYPQGVKCTHHLIDALVASNRYANALEVAKEFLETHPTHQVGGINCECILKAWQERVAVPKPTTEENLNADHHDEELDLLNFYYKLIQLLYITGDLKCAAALLETIKPASALVSELSPTSMRNNASFTYIDSLIAVEGTVEETLRKEKKPLYVLGDSHVLSVAWRSLHLNKIGEVLLKPLVVMDCKIWQLRKESDFYTKVHFFHLLKEIPRQSEVIFILGDMDCRQSILEVLAKGIATTMDEAIKIITDSYQNILLQVTAQKRFKKLYVHPVAPVVDETRWIMIAFNRALSAKLIALRQRDPKTPLRWLHIETEILNLGKETLKEEYKLDGSHLHPRYMTLIEEAINTLEEYE